MTSLLLTPSTILSPTFLQIAKSFLEFRQSRIEEERDSNSFGGKSDAQEGKKEEEDERGGRGGG